MQAAILAAPGKLTIETVPTPSLAPGDVLVKVVAATTCGTDLKAFRRGHPQIPMPGPFGHEYSGIVAGVGSGSPNDGPAKFDVGDAVFGVHSAPCGECLWCKRGEENLCETIMDTKVLGTFAEYVRIPKRIADRHLFLKPVNLPFPVAALIEPLACVYQGLQEVTARPDDRVLVVGPGAIGLLFVIALKLRGYENITLAGRNPDRLAVGAALGARTVPIGQLEDLIGHGFDTVVECTGQKSVWESSLGWVRRGGQVILFGGLPSGTEVSWSAGRLHYDHLHLVSPFHFGSKAVSDAETALVSNPDLFAQLISGSRPLSALEQTLADLEAGKGIKFAITPGTESGVSQ